MEIERFTPSPVPSAAPAFPPVVAPAPEADADPGPDRDRVALEALEAELAVLEDELARVDRGRTASSEPASSDPASSDPADSDPD